MPIPVAVARAWILATNDASHPDHADLRAVVDTAISIADEAGSLEAVTGASVA